MKSLLKGLKRGVAFMLAAAVVVGSIAGYSKVSAATDYSKYSGTDVELAKDNKVIIVRQSDILAVIEK